MTRPDLTDAEQREKPVFLTDYARMWDLVRYQRSALLDAGLITRDEYALLLSTESEHTGESRPSPSRLESYDELAAALRAQGEELTRLRELLWLRHGCQMSALYGDDGQMQCSACGLDFKNDPPERINRVWTEQGAALLKLLNESPEPPPALRRLLGGTSDQPREEPTP